MSNYIKWQAGTTWCEIDTTDFAHMPQAHVLNLFRSGKIPVVARQGDAYVVNTPELEKVYRKRGKQVETFQGLYDRSAVLHKKFCIVGFSIMV